MLDTVLDRIAQDHRTTLADCAPGSGKTYGSQNVMNELFREGRIGTAAIFTPRLNLVSQYERAWARDCKTFAPPRMGKLEATANTTPLVHPDSFGYAATYQALTRQPNLHVDRARQYAGRFLLVCDEAQFLGIEGDLGGGTKAARLVQELSGYAFHTLVMTGTKYRSDRGRIFGGVYSPPDALGYIRLLADVESTYREGVTEEYLRPFQGELRDAEMTWKWADGEQERLSLSEDPDALYRFVQQPEVWQPKLDATVERVRFVQQLASEHCGLVAFSSQAAVEEGARYLRSRHRGVRFLIAKSEDGREAVENLAEFKRGGYDLLLTVNMAYIGYDHPAITVVCPLTNYRWPGYLFQLCARGMRAWEGLPYNQQRVHIIAPQDPKMVEFLEWLRAESDAGLRERGGGPPGPPRKPRLGYAEDVAVHDPSAVGYDPSGDLSADQYQRVRSVVAKHGLAGIPETGLWAAIKELREEQAQQPAPSVAVATIQAPEKTRKELRTEWGQRCQKAIARLIFQSFPGIDSRRPAFRAATMTVGAKLNDVQVVPNAEHLTIKQWEERYALIQRWIVEGASWLNNDQL